MAKYTDAEGNEVEAFTQEEMDAKITEGADALKKEHEAAINKSAEDLKAANEKIAGFGKDGKKKEGEEEEGNAEIKAMQDQINELKTEKETDRKEALLGELAGTDDELRKKIEHEYGQFNAEDQSESAINERMLKAANLASPELQADTIKSAASSLASTRGVDKGAAEKVATTTEQKEFSSNMGVSEADMEKYGAAVDAELNAGTNN